MVEEVLVSSQERLVEASRKFSECSGLGDIKSLQQRSVRVAIGKWMQITTVRIRVGDSEGRAEEGRERG